MPLVPKKKAVKAPKKGSSPVKKSNNKGLVKVLGPESAKPAWNNKGQPVKTRSAEVNEIKNRTTYVPVSSFNRHHLFVRLN